MRVSLQIDGDASGAQKAAQDASAAVADLGKQTEAISKAIEDGFKNATGAIEGVKNASQAAGAANDNNAGSAANLVGKLNQVVGAAAGADSTLAKAANGAISFAKGFGELVKSVGTVNVLSGAIGLAITVATTFFGIVNSGGADANKRLDEQARLIGVVKDAFSGATSKADEFYKKSQDIVTLQASQALIGAQAELKKQATVLASGATGQQNPIFGSDLGAGFGASDTDAAKVSAFQGAIDSLLASISRGAIDIDTYRAEIAKIGNAAQSSNPEIAAQANALLKASEGATEAYDSVAKYQAMLAAAKGTATDAQKALLGITSAAAQSGNEFDRLTKSMERQAAAQEAESQTAGKSAGEAAKLRAQFILVEAATQSGAGNAEKYAAQIDAIATRFGNAAQKAATFKLQSDTSFNLDQLGRSTTDASVADQLRGAFGNNADQNSSLANAIRFNETMKDIKATTLDVATGAFHDLRTELQSGKTAFEALGTAGVDALNKIIDKMADKAIENLISGALGNAILGPGGGGIFQTIFGAFGLDADPGSSSSPLAGLTADDYGAGFDAGGFTGSGGKYQVAGVVHKGEYVFDQVATNRIGVNTLARLHRGYADGGLVSSGGPIPWSSSLGPSAEPNNRGGGSQAVHVTVGVSVDNKGELQAFVKDVSSKSFNDGLSNYVGSPAHVRHVADATRQGKIWRLLS